MEKALIWRNESVHTFYSFGAVFGFSAVNTLAPHFETRRFHIRPHNCDNFGFGNAELIFDSVKSRTVFPRHSDYSIGFRIAKFACHFIRFLQIIFRRLNSLTHTLQMQHRGYLAAGFHCRVKGRISGIISAAISVIVDFKRTNN